MTSPARNGSLGIYFLVFYIHVKIYGEITISYFPMYNGNHLSDLTTVDRDATIHSLLYSELRHD